MISAALDAINETYIQALVDAERAEDRYIDFKLDFGLEHPWEGLAADVCAFANTDGGLSGRPSLQGVMWSVERDSRKIATGTWQRIEARLRARSGRRV
jgi:hypothetical protein